MSIEGQCHFCTIYFPGFVCFVLYLDKISGERLQDHWSSGLTFLEQKWQMSSLVKTDIEDAFRIVPINPYNHHLLSFQ